MVNTKSSYEYQFRIRDEFKNRSFRKIKKPMTVLCANPSCNFNDLHPLL